MATERRTTKQWKWPAEEPDATTECWILRTARGEPDVCKPSESSTTGSKTTAEPKTRATEAGPTGH